MSSPDIEREQSVSRAFVMLADTLSASMVEYRLLTWSGVRAASFTPPSRGEMYIRCWAS